MRDIVAVGGFVLPNAGSYRLTITIKGSETSIINIDTMILKVKVVKEK